MSQRLTRLSPSLAGAGSAAAGRVAAPGPPNIVYVAAVGAEAVVNSK